MVQTINQCPMAGGNAVFRARALYALIKPNIKYNDKEICGLVGISLREATSTTQVSNAKIYPNPTNEKATLEYNLDCKAEGSFLITNGLGQKVYLHKLAGEKGYYEFSTASLLPGIYNCTVTCSTSIVSTIKLVIIR